jgi:hypothetical protein
MVANFAVLWKKVKTSVALLQRNVLAEVHLAPGGWVQVRAVTSIISLTAAQPPYLVQIADHRSQVQAR